MSEYAERNAEAQGEAYNKHISAMTSEGLYFKTDIAAELAHRDIEIESLKGKIYALEQTIDVLTGGKS